MPSTSGVQFAHGLMTAGGDAYFSGTTVPSPFPDTHGNAVSMQAGKFGTLVPVPLYLAGNHHNNADRNVWGVTIEMPLRSELCR